MFGVGTAQVGLLYQSGVISTNWFSDFFCGYGPRMSIEISLDQVVADCENKMDLTCSGSECATKVREWSASYGSEVEMRTIYADFQITAIIEV